MYTFNICMKTLQFCVYKNIILYINLCSIVNDNERCSENRKPIIIRF